MEEDVRQALIYDYLRYCMEGNYQPSYMEVAAACGLSTTLVLADLGSLRSHGCIGWFDEQPNAIHIVGEFEYTPG